MLSSREIANRLSLQTTTASNGASEKLARCIILVKLSLLPTVSGKTVETEWSLALHYSRQAASGSFVEMV